MNSKEIPNPDISNEPQEALFTSWLISGPRVETAQQASEAYPPSFKAEIPIGLGTIKKLWEEYKEAESISPPYSGKENEGFRQWLVQRGAVVFEETTEKRPLMVKTLN